MADTARLLALLEAATPRPWKGDRYDGTIKYSVLGGEEGQYYVFSINHSPGEDFDADVFNYGDEDETLMLEAVNALPGLIAENERLRAALRCIATWRTYQEGELPVTPSELREIARETLRYCDEALNAKG